MPEETRSIRYCCTIWWVVFGMRFQFQILYSHNPIYDIAIVGLKKYYIVFKLDRGPDLPIILYSTRFNSYIYRNVVLNSTELWPNSWHSNEAGKMISDSIFSLRIRSNYTCNKSTVISSALKQPTHNSSKIVPPTFRCLMLTSPYADYTFLTYR